MIHRIQGFKTVLRVSTVTSAGHNVQTGVVSALTISTIMINTCSGETTVQAKKERKTEKKNAVIVEQFVSANTIKFSC